MSTLLLEIVTPEGRVFSEQVNMVIVKGAEGELGILPQHIPLVTPLKIHPVTIKQDGVDDRNIAVHGGFVEIRKDKVVILAESAELPDDIDVERAVAAKERAQQRMFSKSLEGVDLLRAKLAMERAENRLRVKKEVN